MARTYSASEVKGFQRTYQELYAKFRQVDNLADRCRTQIQNAASKLAASDSSEILKTIPVDELTRYKKGIRVKALHDAGYHTISDILKAQPSRISVINGISPEGAQDIKKAAALIANTAHEGAKIRLSADDKNPEATALVTALCQYKMILPA
ncbi:MAG: hypothetical protein IJR57_04255, partial [Ruminococcus sp.]|nr:hypothetical protein [Ruminococcus sp.]